MAGARAALLIGRRKGLDKTNFFTKDLPSPRTVKLLLLLRTGRDPDGPW